MLYSQSTVDGNEIRLSTCPKLWEPPLTHESVTWAPNAGSFDYNIGCRFRTSSMEGP